MNEAKRRLEKYEHNELVIMSIVSQAIAGSGVSLATLNGGHIVYPIINANQTPIVTEMGSLFIKGKNAFGVNWGLAAGDIAEADVLAKTMEAIAALN